MNRLDRPTASAYAAWFRPLTDPTRLLVLNLLAVEGPLSVGDIVERLDVGQATISQHLKILMDARFVVVEQIGTRRYYCVNPCCLERFPTAAALVMGRVTPVSAPEVPPPPWAVEAVAVGDA